MLDLLTKRRSIRKFQATPVEREKIEALQEAALRSPSSRGLNPWEFIFVTDPSVLQQIARAKEHGSAFVGGAPLAVVVAADPNACDVWIEDCSIASIILQLTAESLGLGSCWSQIRLRSHGSGESADRYLQKLLDLPDSHVVEAVIAIGYPAEKKAGHARESLLRRKIHANRFGGK